MPVHGTAAASARTTGANVLIFADSTPYSSRLDLALVVAVELGLRYWPGDYGDTNPTGFQVGCAGENLELELCSIFSFHFVLYCVVADEEDNEKLRLLILAGAEHRTRWTALLLVGAFC